MTPLLEAVGVSVPGRLFATDFRIEAPSMVALIGPNGGGKTSLLRALVGVEDARGVVRICGADISAAPPPRRVRLLSFLPASRDLIWPISAHDIVALGLPGPDPHRIEELLDLLELRPLAHRPVSHLSTGERSRVLFARALAARPQLLLLDEPLSNLDPYWVLRTIDILRQTVEQERCAALVSLHDLAQVPAFDRVLLVNQGRVALDAAPEAALGSVVLSQTFRVEQSSDGWRVSLSEDRRSSQ